MKLLIIFYLVFALGGLGLAAEDNLEVKGKIQTDSLILIGGSDFPATPVKGEVFYRSDLGQKRFYTFDGQSWSGGNDKTVATKIVAASNSLGTVAGVNPKADYVCVGTDDQLTIQTAIDALGADGGAVYLLEGTYNLSDSINLDNIAPNDSGKSLIGAGKATVLRASLGSINLINASSVNGIIISRLSLDGNSLASTNGIFLNTVTYSKIDKLWIERIARDGLRLNFSTNNNTISNCQIQQGTGSFRGIFLLGFSNNNLIQNNHISGNGADGIDMANSSQNRLLANTVSGNFSDSGIHLSNSSDNTVSENNLRNSGWFGIRLENNCSNNLLSHNLISQSSMDGIYVYNSNNNIISGNTILNNTGRGMQIDISANNLILANLLSENMNGGIQIISTGGGPPRSNFLSSNRISSSFSGYGIYIDSDEEARGTYLAGNFIDGAGYALTATSGSILDMNTISAKNTRYTDKTKLTLEPVTDIDGNRIIENTRPVSYVRVDQNGVWTVANGKSAGDILVLEKSLPVGGSAIFNSSGNLKLGANPRNLSQNDTLTLIWDGSFWVEIGFSDN